jgi:hypothetical protein
LALKQLEQSNPTASKILQKNFVNAAISPTNQKRFVNAFLVVGKEALKQLLDDSYLNIAIMIMKEWQKADTKLQSEA